MSGIIGFVIGLGLGIAVTGMAAMLHRAEYHPDDKDEEIRQLQANNEAMGDFVNELIGENKDLKVAVRASHDAMIELADMAAEFEEYL